MHILIAPNAYKNSLSAGDAAIAIAKGLMTSALNCSTECFPVADGGDGTADLIINKFNGVKVNVTVSDPLHRAVQASFGLIHEGRTAVIEMADASGIRLLASGELDPMKASSYGTGEMICRALDHGVSEIIIGLGGSATVDGGAGMLSALGARFLDSAGSELKPQPGSLSNLSRIDISALDSRLFGVKITVLCDVDNCLLGEQGAAKVFGPQKGASANDIPGLDFVLEMMAKLCLEETGRSISSIKHGGAAGGIAAALFGFCKARLVTGAEHFLDLTGFDDSLKRSQLLITGEGSVDEQTLQGKAPFAVASSALKYNIPVVGLGGRIPLAENKQLAKYFNVLMAIGHEPSSLGRAMEHTEANLVRTGRLIGNLFAVSGSK